MGAGMTYFRSACETKGIDPWQLLQMLLALLTGLCPTPPKNKADLDRVRFKRGRLIGAGLREGLSFEDAVKTAEGALAILAESSDANVTTFLSELE